jgi:hypothetical protein
VTFIFCEIKISDPALQFYFSLSVSFSVSNKGMIRRRSDRCGSFGSCRFVSLLIFSLSFGFFFRDIFPSNTTTTVQHPLTPVLESSSSVLHNEQIESVTSPLSASASSNQWMKPSLNPVSIPLPPPPPPPPPTSLPPPLPPSSILPPSPQSSPSSPPLHMSLPWTPEVALLSLTGEGRCAQSEAVEQWLPTLLRNVDHMIADDKLFSKILLENTILKTFGSCGSGIVRISQEQHPSLYGDFRDCMKTVRAIPDSRYCDPVIFHSFWGNLPVRKQAIWFIISFLLTQDPEYSELWIWSPPGVAVSSDPLMAPIVALAGSRVHFKTWNASHEAKNTQLEKRPDVLTVSHDQRFWLDTDLLRSLALRVYGGVYVDMDVLLLRNLGPLLGDEWLYQWGTHCVLSNGAIMRFKKDSPVSNRLLDTIIATKPIPDSTCWGKDAYIKAKPFTRLPICFLNAGWMTNNGEDKAFFNNVPHLSRWSGAFAFHLHGGVFSQGDQAATNSEYAQSKSKVWSMLVKFEPVIANTLSLLIKPE